MGLELGGMGLWTYLAKPPEEPYAYILDDEGIVYNPNSLWPFWTSKSRYNGHKSNPTIIRIVPDTHRQAWGQEYILLGDRPRSRRQVYPSTSLLTRRDCATWWLIGPRSWMVLQVTKLEIESLFSYLAKPIMLPVFLDPSGR